MPNILSLLYGVFPHRTVHTHTIQAPRTMHVCNRPTKTNIGLHPPITSHHTDHIITSFSSPIHPSLIPPPHSTIFKDQRGCLQRSEDSNTSSEQASGTESNLSSAVGDLDGSRASSDGSVGRWDGSGRAVGGLGGVHEAGCGGGCGWSIG